MKKLMRKIIIFGLMYAMTATSVFAGEPVVGDVEGVSGAAVETSENDTLEQDEMTISLDRLSLGTSGTSIEYKVSWTYDEKTGELVLRGNAPMNNFREAYGSYPWESSSIGSNLKKVIIENGITDISTNAFSNCQKLKEVEMSDSVTSIGACAFYQCRSLESIKLSDGLEAILGNVFEGCSSLTQIELPASLKSIESPTFNHCTSMEAITVKGGSSYFSSLDGVLYNKDRTKLIKFPCGKKMEADQYTVPDGVKIIDDYAFEACSLRKIVLPESLTSIGELAFHDSYLNSIVLPNSVSFIGNNAFHNCNIRNINIPSSLTRIEPAVFSDCRLEEIVIPDTVTYIGDYAFLRNPIKTVTIPKSVTTIEYNPFEGCKSLTRIDVDSENPAFTSKDGVLLNKDMSVLRIFPSGRRGIYVVPDTVNTIATSSFSNAVISKIIIPESVTKVEGQAVDICDDLEGVYFQGNAPETGAGSPFLTSSYYKKVNVYRTFKSSDWTAAAWSSYVLQYWNGKAVSSINHSSMPNDVFTTAFDIFNATDKDENIVVVLSICDNNGKMIGTAAKTVNLQAEKNTTDELSIDLKGKNYSPELTICLYSLNDGSTLQPFGDKTQKTYFVL